MNIANANLKEIDNEQFLDDEKYHQYLTFIMGNEEYGIDIMKVKEIRSYETPTKIPASPNFVKGVINIRGSIVPIIGLREKFKLRVKEYSKKTVVIVMQLNIKGIDRMVGFIVDAISEVHDLDLSNLKPAPDTTVDNGQDYIEGLSSTGGKMIIILNSEKLLSFQEMQDLQEF